LFLAFCYFVCLGGLNAVHAEEESVLARKEGFFSLFRLGGVATGGSNANANGGVLGLSVGYQMDPNFSASAFIDGAFTLDGDWSRNTAFLYGLEGGYTLNPESRYRLVLGLKGGQFASKSWPLLAPYDYGGIFTTWAVGPKLGFHYDLSSLMSVGAETSALWVFGGTTVPTTVSGGSPINVSGFVLASFAVTLGFHL